MTFAGMAMTSVGERPRHRDVRPSLRAILRRPSRVEVKFLRRVSSTAQSAAGEEVEVEARGSMVEGVTMQ